MSAGGALPEEHPPPLPDTAPLARQTLAYGLTGLIGPLVGMITLPIFARVFTRSEYGLVELGTTTMTVALAVADAGFTAAALRSYYDYKDEHEAERRGVLFTALIATMTVSFTLGAVLFALRGEFATWMFGHEGEAALVAIIALTLPVMNLFRFVCETMRLRLQATNYLITNAVDAFAASGLGVAVVLATDWRVKGLFAAALVGHLAASLYGLSVVRGALRGSFSRPELRRMAAYGLPLVPTTLAAWALALVDRIILARLRDLEQVGQYAIANRLAVLLMIAMNAFILALTPFLFSIYSEDPAQEKAARGRTLTYFAFILSLGGLLLTLYAKELVDIIAPKFGESYKAVGPLALGIVGYGLATVLTTGISLARQTLYVVPLAVGSAVLNIALNFALIPPWGFIGSAVATAAGYLVLAASYYWAAQRFYPTPYEPAKVMVIVGTASALGVLGVVPLGPVEVEVVLKLGAVAAFVGILALTGTMGRGEFSELLRFVRGMNPLRRGAAAEP